MSRLLHAYLDTTLETLAVRLPAARGWLGRVTRDARAALDRDGRLDAWEDALSALPAPAPGVGRGVVDLRAEVAVRLPSPPPAAFQRALSAALKALVPWRKGPFHVLGVDIDAEWRSDWKWARLLPHVGPLTGRRVIDVGCGNGYYAWRMLGAGAELVLGLDPAPLCLAQFLAVQRYVGAHGVHLLPLGSAALDAPLELFDIGFSMGVLYHRRDPERHLAEMRRALVAGGQLVLETLVLDSAADTLLAPSGRYARMPNVRAVPSPARVVRWLTACGFTGARLVDLSVTSAAEQRSTAWMPFHSLIDFLDPADPARTVEGYPAPRRGMFVAVAS